MRYDESTPYRGPLDTLALAGDWRAEFAGRRYAGVKDWDVALVTEIQRPCSDGVRVDETGIERPINEIAWVQGSGFRTDWSCAFIELQDGSWGVIPWEGLKWAANSIGVSSSGDLLSPGDIVVAERQSNGTHRLRQIPEVGGLLWRWTRIRAVFWRWLGGWDHQLFPFNSATQGQRQPGSTFKPFVYLTALDLAFACFNRL